MPETDRAIMLGIRHRCGQEVQFWIPADLVTAIARSLDESTEALGLAQWMEGEGLLADLDESPPGESPSSTWTGTPPCARRAEHSCGGSTFWPTMPTAPPGEPLRQFSGP
jgi:hypothetical protein